MTMCPSPWCHLRGQSNVLSTRFTFTANVSRSQIVHVGVLGFVAKKVPMQECLRSFFCRTHTHTCRHNLIIAKFQP